MSILRVYHAVAREKYTRVQRIVERVRAVDLTATDGDQAAGTFERRQQPLQRNTVHALLGRIDHEHRHGGRRRRASIGLGEQRQNGRPHEDDVLRIAAGTKHELRTPRIPLARAGVRCGIRDPIMLEAERRAALAESRIGTATLMPKRGQADRRRPRRFRRSARPLRG